MKGHSFKKFKHSGIVLDLPTEEVPPEAWTGGQNVQFQDGATRKVGGYSRYADPVSAAPLFSMAILRGADAFWIYCGATSIWATDGVTHWDLTPTGGLTEVGGGFWSGTILNGIPVLNNGLDPPVYWDLDITHDCLPLPGWPTGATCKVIRAFKYHLFALNVSVDGVHYPDALYWSAGAEPGAIPQEWTPSASNDAGDMILADTPGQIVDGLSMRDAFVVYKEASTYMLSYIAGQYVYTQRKAFLTSGLQAINCIAEINGNHWVFTGSDVIQHDGQSWTSIVDMKIKRTLVDSVEPSRRTLCCIATRIKNSQIWVCIPEAGNQWLNKAYVINTITGDIGIRNLPNVAHVARGAVEAANVSPAWDQDGDAWDADVTFWDQQTYSAQSDSLLMADFDGSALFSVDSSDLADGVVFPAFVERLSLPIDEMDTITRRFITRILPRLEGETGDVVYVRVGSQNYFGQSITWSDPQPFVIGQDVGVSIQLEGRLMSIRFTGDTARMFKIHSYVVEYTDRGLY